MTNTLSTEVESFMQNFHALEMNREKLVTAVIIWVGRCTFISLELIDLC